MTGENEKYSKYYQESYEPVHQYTNSPNNKFEFISKIFTWNKKPRKAARLKSPLLQRAPIRKLSPRQVYMSEPGYQFNHAESLLPPGGRGSQYPVPMRDSPRGDRPEQMKRLRRIYRQPVLFPPEDSKDNAADDTDEDPNVLHEGRPRSRTQN